MRKQLRCRNVSKWLLWTVVGCGLPACTSFRESPKYHFVDGTYTAKLGNEPKQRLFVITQADSTFRAYPVRRRPKQVIDSNTFQIIRLPLETRLPIYKQASFSKSSLDVDVLTTLVKFRPARSGVPTQLNTTLNASVFLGQRYDYFRIKYMPTPLGMHQRKGVHYGLSYGLFSGFGNAGITPTTTAGKTQLEYEGIVWQSGIAVIVGVNNFTFGLTLGSDYLLNADRRIWIYQRKPWLGVAVGLNLN